MKIAVFSDIHGNYEALRTVLSMINAEKPDKTVFLGDIFQRGDKEIECLDYLINSGIICVKGNCELYVENGVEIDPDVEYLREYYDSMREKLTAVQREFISKMPLSYEFTVNERKIMFSHFLFKDKKAAYPYYQLSDIKTDVFSNAIRSEEVQKYDLVTVGHTHGNFVNENVVGVSAAGIGKPAFILLAIGETVSYRYISA